MVNIFLGYAIEEFENKLMNYNYDRAVDFHQEALDFIKGETSKEEFIDSIYTAYCDQEGKREYKTLETLAKRIIKIANY